MNDRDEKIMMEPAPNHVSNTEDSLFKKLNPPQENNGNLRANSLPNSTDLISNESSNNITGINDSENLNETDRENNVYTNDSLVEDNNQVSSDKDVINENASNTLPHTAILLETEWGSKVYVVGTAHFSEESQEDVAKVIRAVQPNFVVLELCESRSYMLKWQEDELLKVAEKMDFKMMRDTMKTYGLLHSIMYLLLLSVSAEITRELGMAPGGEFRRAYKEASNIPGCVVHLGDRPIEITLRRAFASMSWWQSIKFAFYVIFSNKKFDEEEIEKCKNRDHLEEMLAMLGGEFPELKKVFVNERDLFLSYSLITASMLSTGPQGVVPNTVVGVVGMGHLAGIQRNWQRIDPIELRRVIEIPPPSRTSKVLKFTIKASVLCLALYGVHKLASKTKFYSSLFR